MAEILAGTLTAAVVNLAKDKLTSAIAGQANLLWNFGDDLEDMNSVLESISAALHEAEKRSPKERRVQLWLKRLKHTATDISDILEDYQDTSERLTAKNSEDHMAAQYTMHDLVHDLATLIMGDELIVSYDASKSKNAHSHKYCRYVLATRYDKASKLSNVLPSKWML
nr:unnamed protein product [Digitaria exilis]